VPTFLAEARQARDVIPESNLPDVQAGFFTRLAKSLNLRALSGAIDA
jgi:hypothetical protein